MRRISLRAFEQELEIGIRNHLCVQAWLGYGNVLFLGFGEEVLPPRLPGERYPRPRYQLATHYADWRVKEQTKELGTGDDPYEQALAACRSLVGHRATDWSLNQATLELIVHFEGELTVEIIPLSDADVLSEETWNFRNPAGEYLTACCGGKLFLVRGDETPAFGDSADDTD